MLGAYRTAKIHQDIRVRSNGIHCQFARFCAILLKSKENRTEKHNLALLFCITQGCNAWALALFFKVSMRECFVGVSCNGY